METVGTSIPIKMRDAFDKMTTAGVMQSDAVAAGILMFMCIEDEEERREVIRIARGVRKHWSNDRR